MEDQNIKEILVTYEDGSEVIYRGKGIRKFFRENTVPEIPTQKQPQTSGGYHVSGVTYTPNKEMSPMELARQMKEQAEKSSGIKFG